MESLNQSIWSTRVIFFYFYLDVKILVKSYDYWNVLYRVLRIEREPRALRGTRYTHKPQLVYSTAPFNEINARLARKCGKPSNQSRHCSLAIGNRWTETDLMNAITLLLASNRLNKKKKGGVTNARGTDLPFTSIEFSRGCLLSRAASYDPPTGLRHDSSRVVFNKFIDYRAGTSFAYNFNSQSLIMEFY